MLLASRAKGISSFLCLPYPAARPWTHAGGWTFRLSRETNYFPPLPWSSSWIIVTASWLDLCVPHLDFLESILKREQREPIKSRDKSHTSTGNRPRFPPTQTKASIPTRPRRLHTVWPLPIPCLSVSAHLLALFPCPSSTPPVFQKSLGMTCAHPALSAHNAFPRIPAWLTPPLLRIFTRRFLTGGPLLVPSEGNRPRRQPPGRCLLAPLPCVLLLCNTFYCLVYFAFTGLLFYALSFLTTT